MPTRASDPESFPAAVSISQMARRLTLSRQRFYELVAKGVFPPPCYCPISRRALYPAELQRQCLEIRENQIGANGLYVIFYERRPDPMAQAVSGRPRRSSGSPPGRDPALESIREGLTALGLPSMSDDQIRSAIHSAYPSGTAGIDTGTILAAVFRLLRRPSSARQTPAT